MLKKILFPAFSGIFLAIGLTLFEWNFMLLSYKRLSLHLLAFFPLLFALSYVYFQWLLPQLKPESPTLEKMRTHIFPLILVSVTASGILVPFFESPLRYTVTLGLISAALFTILTMLIAPLLLHPSRRVGTLYAFAVFIVGLLGMGIYFYTSFFVRMYGDDYCYAMLADQLGYWGAVGNFYLSWSGRAFSNLLVLAFSECRYAPLVQIIILVAVIFVVVFISTLSTNNRRLLWASSAAFFLPFSILSTTTDLYKALYWIVSSVAVFPVLIALPCYLVLILHYHNKSSGNISLAILLGFSLSLTIATTHEVATISIILFNLLLVFLLIVIKRHKEKKSLSYLLCAGLAGSIAGLIIVILSPGNHARHIAQNYPDPPAILELLQMTAKNFWGFGLRIVEHKQWIALIAVFSFGYMLETALSRRREFLLICSFATIVLAASCFLPGAYAMSSSIPPRSQIIPTSFLVYGVFIGGLFTPRLKIDFWSATMFSLLLLFIIGFEIRLLRSEIKTIAPVVNYARLWDERDRQIRENGLGVYTIETWDEVEQNYYCVESYYQEVKCYNEKY